MRPQRTEWILPVCWIHTTVPSIADLYASFHFIPCMLTDFSGFVKCFIDDSFSAVASTCFVFRRWYFDTTVSCIRKRWNRAPCQDK